MYAVSNISSHIPHTGGVGMLNEVSHVFENWLNPHIPYDISHNNWIRFQPLLKLLILLMMVLLVSS